MNNRDSPLFWSLPCGTWFLTDVRISIFFPVLILLIGFQLENNFRLALIFGGILFVSVLVHEFAHVAVVRFTGGLGNEILVWPLGGLAFVQPAGTFRSQFLTPAAGPFVNAVLCGITLPAVVDSAHTTEALNPLVFPAVGLSGDVVSDLLVLLFTANWLLLLVNLIPVFPLDGGRMLQSCLKHHWGGETATEIYIRVGLVVAFLMMIAGLIIQSTWLVFFGAIVLVLNILESQQLRAAEAYEESFMGYDFSQGYTSLEKSGEPRIQRRPSLWKRWREKRRAEKERRLREKAAEVDRQLDAILQKVHVHGIQALTDAERRLLNRASARYRQKGKETQ